VTPRPGSFGWLAAHDLRQNWRAFDSAIGGLTPVKTAMLAAALAAVHLGFWWGLRFGGTDGALAPDASLSGYIALGMLFVLPGIVAQAMIATTRALYAHGDLELLLASPVSLRAILAARAVAIAASAVAWFAFLLLPLANVCALAGRLHWLAIYPALAACGLFGAAVGIMLALGFFVMAGPRRARLVAQIAATVVGGAFALGAQGYALLSAATRAALTGTHAAPAPAGWLDWRALVALPARAAAGEPLALALWVLAALIIFVLVVLTLGERFATAAIVSAGAPATARPEKRTHAFRASLGAAMRAKERRLVLRDPWLISQIMLQAVYMLPIGLVLWRNGGATGSPVVAITPVIVVVGAQFAGSLAWLALSGEDAPDLLSAAPIARARVERHKLEAILTPIAVVLAAPIAALAFVSPWSGVCAAICTLGACLSTALLNLWRQAPAQRGMMLRRHSQSKIVGLIEHFLSILWCVAAVSAVMGHWGVALVPIALAGLILWLSRAGRARVILPANA
jgi:ABC-2 type transport system permease protein